MSCGEIPDGLANAEEAEAVMPRRRQIRRIDKSLCQRCKTAKSMYLIRNVTYCKACFQHNVFTRFMKTLHPPLKPSTTSDGGTNAKSKQTQGGLRPPKQIGSSLIGLSGGSSSLTMLDLLISKQYIGDDNDRIIDKTKGEKEPIWNKGFVIYVEFDHILNNQLHGSTTPGNQDESLLTSRLEEIENWVKEQNHNLTFIGLNAEDVFDPNLKKRIKALVGIQEGNEDTQSAEGISVDLKNPDLPLFPIPSSSTSTTTPLDQLRSLLASLPAPSRPSLLSSILTSLITITSQTIPNISHILLGETSTRQAQRLISGTASGKGYTLPLELAVSYKAENAITILKPMKEITTKETAIYSYLKGWNGFIRNERKWDNAGPKSKKDSRGKGDIKSLESLTELFIATLAVTHPSTVSTINRTGDKLMFTGEKGQEVSCPVCQLPVDPHALQWKSRTALTSLPTKTIADISSPDDEKNEKLATLLCYACLTTFTPPTVVAKALRSDTEPVQLPYWIGENVRRKVARVEMKEDIKDFLIGEE
ncbi:uncharacterized protein IL334_002859 [Kwoniella shivajii]|uniref:Cytoplasmic tRNA 2-thiolation protein 2 n=1 Tax=Kwoniella shivajii TaxID=564305 RepID=A0ABZ1CWI3_9TREE|nr:hypothetical protein IL334_002859 [Kwoniella shivajii]